MTDQPFFDPELNFVMESATRGLTSEDHPIVARISEPQKSSGMHIPNVPRDRLLWLAYKPHTDPASEGES